MTAKTINWEVWDIPVSQVLFDKYQFTDFWAKRVCHLTTLYSWVCDTLMHVCVYVCVYVIVCVCERQAAPYNYKSPITLPTMMMIITNCSTCQWRGNMWLASSLRRQETSSEWTSEVASRPVCLSCPLREPQNATDQMSRWVQSCSPPPPYSPPLLLLFCFDRIHDAMKLSCPSVCVLSRQYALKCWKLFAQNLICWCIIMSLNVQKGLIVIFRVQVSGHREDWHLKKKKKMPAHYLSSELPKWTSIVQKVWIAIFKVTIPLKDWILSDCLAKIPEFCYRS